MLGLRMREMGENGGLKDRGGVCALFVLGIRPLGRVEDVDSIF